MMFGFPDPPHKTSNRRMPQTIPRGLVSHLSNEYLQNRRELPFWKDYSPRGVDWFIIPYFGTASQHIPVPIKRDSDGFLYAEADPNNGSSRRVQFATYDVNPLNNMTFVAVMADYYNGDNRVMYNSCLGFGHYGGGYANVVLDGRAWASPSIYYIDGNRKVLTFTINTDTHSHTARVNGVLSATLNRSDYYNPIHSLTSITGWRIYDLMVFNRALSTSEVGIVEEAQRRKFKVY